MTAQGADLHVLRLVPDRLNPHLARWACSCGESGGGYASPDLSRRWHTEHVRESEAARPANESHDPLQPDVDPRHVRAMLLLLGPARMVLDRYADTLGDSPGQPGAEAAGMAQRIVDWIGHPVTDEPAWATLLCVAETDAGDACRTCRPCVARMAAGYEPGLVDGAPVVDPRYPRVEHQVTPGRAAVDAAARWHAWFYEHVDLGPADGDIREALADEFETATGLTLPADIREAF